jgi:hypothetical protein
MHNMHTFGPSSTKATLASVEYDLEDLALTSQHAPIHTFSTSYPILNTPPEPRDDKYITRMCRVGGQSEEGEKRVRVR